MVKVLCPFVYWAQSNKDITLRVDLKDVKDPDITIEEEEIEFSCIGTGSQGLQKYEFLLEFYLPVDKDSAICTVYDREILIKVQKKDEDWWPRLLYEQKKFPWLKIDFDRIKNESESEDEKANAQQDVSYEELLKAKYPDAYKKLQSEELGYLNTSYKKLYLFCYNFFMFCGFLYAFILMSKKYYEEEEKFLPRAFATVGDIFKFLHLLMFLEVLHPLFGYTKGSILESFLQVTGRNIWILLLIGGEERMQTKPVVFYLFMTYSVIELVRYPYYMLRVYDIDLGLITWLRYTLWIPLYPLGFICEGVIALRDIPYFEETEKFSVGLPNKWNFAFYFPNVIRFYLLFGFFPMLYTQMWHMYGLRCKKLGIKKHKSNVKKED